MEGREFHVNADCGIASDRWVELVAMFDELTKDSEDVRRRRAAELLLRSQADSTTCGCGGRAYLIRDFGGALAGNKLHKCSACGRSWANDLPAVLGAPLH